MDKKRYLKFINKLKKEGFEIEQIDECVQKSMENIKQGDKSFIIYGEPQSGKTNMMIALTAALIDSGKNLIVILTQNITDLEVQTYNRFSDSPLKPPPKYFSEITHPDYKIKRLTEQTHIVFCRKDSNNLKTLVDKIKDIPKVIIDDECDYASPNGNINKASKDASKINKRVSELIGTEGHYIGVTATPVRMDLNNTFNNNNKKWVHFKPHSKYCGREFFFPLVPDKIKYQLNRFKKDDLEPAKDLRPTVFRFLVNAAYLNKNKEDTTTNYLMLVHTDRRTLKHEEDRKILDAVFEVLLDQKNKKYDKYVNELTDIANKRYKEEAEEIIQYLFENIEDHSIGVVNSAPRKGAPIDYSRYSEDPRHMFTIAIGGDKASRGITFNNLISMFFTRAALTAQQDTYVQRARMFGNRGDDAKRFDLTIPEELYGDWHRVFYYHALNYRYLVSGDAKYATGTGFRVVATSGIDKKNVETTRGEMYSQKVELTESIKDVLDNVKESDNKLEIFRKLNKISGGLIDTILIDFLSERELDGIYGIVLHKIRYLNKDKDSKYTDYNEILRPRGMIGGTEEKRYPEATHHFLPVSNGSEIRLFYKVSNDRMIYLKNIKNK